MGRALEALGIEFVSVFVDTATHSNARTATHCNTLQCTATHYNALQYAATYTGQQAEVGQALEALGIEFVSEFVDPLTGYSYDFWIPAHAMALEFDGFFCIHVYMCVYMFVY